MPLILMSGVPCSGKTKIANKIRIFFEQNCKKSVHFISEMEAVKNAGFDKNEFYSDSQKEKHIRGLLKSEVIRLITPENVVILDSGNYIKGYRYELYCATKNSKSTQCTVYTLVNFEKAWEENVKRKERLDSFEGNIDSLDDVPYTRDIFDALILRYEEPNSHNRWDNPLVTIMSEDELNLDDLYKVLFEKKPPPPNMSTQNAPLSSTNFLYEMDKITQDITKAILDAKKLNIDGNLRLPSYPSVLLEGTSVQYANGPKLIRLRRQFLTYAKMHYSNTDITKIGVLFLQYLNTSLQE